MAKIHILDVRLGMISFNPSDFPNGCLICDIDGTIADHTHRVHLILGKPKLWDEYAALVEHDLPIQGVIGVVDKLAAHDWKIVMLTSRAGDQRANTKKWLANHDIPYAALYMRKARDFRPDTEVKPELMAQAIADGYTPSMIFEDRTRIVDLWRERGYNVVQVAEGDF